MQQIFSKISLHNFCAAKVKKKKYANFLAKIFIFFEKSVIFFANLLLLYAKIEPFLPLPALIGFRGCPILKNRVAKVLLFYGMCKYKVEFYMEM